MLDVIVLLLVLLLLGVLLMGAAILQKLTAIQLQVQAALDALGQSIPPAQASEIDAKAQAISESLAAAGFPPPSP